MSHERASYKRIILCADGTWLASDQGGTEEPSNVARIARMIANDGTDADGKIVPQIVSYHSGLGAGELPLEKTISGSFSGEGSIGWGLDTQVCEIYEFVSDNYSPGDEIFFFGFSRGAFTVRSVVGLISDVGVLSSQHMSYFAEMWKAYRENTNGEPFSKTVWYQQHKDMLRLEDVRIKVVGVWDTVGSLGIPEWPLVNLASKVGIALNKKYEFHNTKVSKNVDLAFQALAIDERRLTFPPTLWHKTANAPAKELQQCWFPGVHGDIGGGAKNREITDIAFAWMVDNLSGMLAFEEVVVDDLIQQHQDARAKRISADHLGDNSWGCGPIVSNFAGVEGAFFRVLGVQDRTPGNYPPTQGQQPETRDTNESFHPIVRVRKTILTSQYRPAALTGYTFERPKGPQGARAGWYWDKKGMAPAIPEFVLRPEKKLLVANGTGYAYRDSLSRTMCPEHLLVDLDQDNGVADSLTTKRNGRV
ncbi:uncharacterized protein N7482_010123 [Penicillium canariense]|uniref:T6SS Phospholipase effector Tle1-like catalytic domain-containing protein n=1 Tax=Penicillium canariense TaxID=189055 RepID=A0A9W9HLV9_9EURO|nr:uncharacterized protein N7482_010123 [Penicillium canariense]KAJ5150871.1 hypothetical protein N7482_010123 [Penicillium canariense]